MVARLWPADPISGAPSYTGRYLRQSQSPFLAGATAARPLGALSGVRPGTPSSTVTATSTTWTVQPFAGVIDLQTAAISGPYTFAFDAVVTGAVTAAGGSARIDALSVRVNDGAEGDGTTVAPFADIVYTAGTASPPAVPARSFVIAYINVPASGGGSPTVTWNASYAVAAGGILPVATVALLNASTAVGTIGQRATVFADPISANNGDWVSNGTAFTKYLPKFPHTEFTTSIAGVPDNTVVNAGTITNDATMTTDTTFWTLPGAGVSLAAGIYSVRWLVTIGSPSTGRCFTSILSNTTQVARDSADGGEDTWSVQVVDIYLTATTIVNFQLFKITGGSTTGVGRIFITKLS